MAAIRGIRSPKGPLLWAAVALIAAGCGGGNSDQQVVDQPAAGSQPSGISQAGADSTAAAPVRLPARQVWEVAMPDVTSVDLALTDELVVVAGQDGRSYDVRVVAFEKATGRQAWSVVAEPELLMATITEEALFLSADPYDSYDDEYPVRAYDLATGAAIWTSQERGAVVGVIADAVVLEHAVVNIDTGITRKSLGDERIVRAVNDEVIVVEDGDELIALDPGTLAERWRIPGGHIRAVSARLLILAEPETATGGTVDESVKAGVSEALTGSTAGSSVTQAPISSTTAAAEQMGSSFVQTADGTVRDSPVEIDADGFRTAICQDARYVQLGGDFQGSLACDGTGLLLHHEDSRPASRPLRAIENVATS